MLNVIMLILLVYRINFPFTQPKKGVYVVTSRKIKIDNFFKFLFSIFIFSYFIYIYILYILNFEIYICLFLYIF